VLLVVLFVSLWSVPAGAYSFGWTVSAPATAQVGQTITGSWNYTFDFTSPPAGITSDFETLLGSLTVGTQSVPIDFQFSVDAPGDMPSLSPISFSTSFNAAGTYDVGYGTVSISDYLCGASNCISLGPTQYDIAGAIVVVSPATLIPIAVKQSAANISDELETDEQALGYWAFANTATKTIADAVTAFVGGIIGTPAAAQYFSKQILSLGENSINVASLVLGCSEGLLDVPGCALAVIGAGMSVTQQLASIVADDPPDPNYTTVYAPQIETPPQPLTQACSSLNSALGLDPYAIDQVNDWLYALYVTNNRYETAVAANDPTSAAIQLAAFQTDYAQYVAASQVAGSDLGCLVQLMDTAGIGADQATPQGEADGLAFLESQDPATLNGILAGLGFISSDTTTLLADVESNPPSFYPVNAIDPLISASDAYEATPVPEPGTFAILGCGFVALSCCRRRRAKRDRGPCVALASHRDTREPVAKLMAS
jgi:hypothetical protein